MANLITRRISDFNKLESLSGDELLIVSYNNKTYNIPIKYILGTIITSISQVESEDGTQSTVNIRTDDAKIQSFIIKNGSKGPMGDTGARGEKGLTGDAGKLITEDLEIIDNLTSTDTDKPLSAKQGKVLGDAMSELMEVYLHSEQAYKKLLEDGNVLDNVKYSIYEEGESTEAEINYELEHLYEVVDAQLRNTTTTV